MEVLSHRGYWLDAQERNKPVAFSRSFDLGIGTETDLRDYMGRVVVAHDMADEAAIDFEHLLQIMDGRNLTLALNIKADGLAEPIADLLKCYGQTNYFVFDMSIPEMVRQLHVGNTAFTGLSDIQPQPVLAERCRGIWLDAFNSEWYDALLVDDLLEQGKRVCVVSSDLHKRPTNEQWNRLAKCRHLNSADLLLCTDKPLDAKRFFKF